MTAFAPGPDRRNKVTATATKTNLLGLSQGDLELFLAELGEKPFRARQILQWIYQRDVDDFGAMTDLSKALRAKLNETASIEAAMMPACLSRISTSGGFGSVYPLGPATICP